MTNGRGRIVADWGIIWFALVFIAFGSGFGGFGAYQLITTYDFLDGATEIQAEVIENPESCDDDGCTWWPKLKFTAADGTQQSMRTRYGASNYGYSVGAEVSVHYNPRYPYLRVTGPDNLWLLGGVFGALGGLVFCIGIWLFARYGIYRKTAD